MTRLTAEEIADEAFLSLPICCIIMVKKKMETYFCAALLIVSLNCDFWFLPVFLKTA